MAEQLNWQLNSSTSTPLTSEARRIQVVEVFLKNQHPPRRLSLGDTAETCRFFRGSSAPQLTSDAKSSKKKLPEASTNLDGTTSGWTSGWRFKGGRHAVYSSKKKTYIRTQQVVTAPTVSPEAVRWQVLWELLHTRRQRRAHLARPRKSGNCSGEHLV